MDQKHLHANKSSRSTQRVLKTQLTTHLLRKDCELFFGRKKSRDINETQTRFQGSGTLQEWCLKFLFYFIFLVGLKISELKSCLFFTLRIYRLLSINPESFCPGGEICNLCVYKLRSASLCSASYQPQEGAICMGTWLRAYVLYQVV